MILLFHDYDFRPPSPMTLDEFTNLFSKMHYRALKPIVMSTEFDIETSRLVKVRSLLDLVQEL